MHDYLSEDPDDPQNRNATEASTTVRVLVQKYTVSDTKI
jgi:hypothetical protein